MEEKAVIVTTEHRGVFFGYVTPKTDLTAKIIELKNARLCVYWCSDVKGFMGLGVTGPLNGSRIGPRTNKIILQNVTSVIEPTEIAIKAWESDLWK